MTFSKITLVFTEPEMRALRYAAEKELRRPKDQAKVFIRRALLGDNRLENANGAGIVRQDTPDAVCA